MYDLFWYYFWRQNSKYERKFHNRIVRKNLDPRKKFSPGQNFLLYIISFFFERNLLRRKAFEKAFPKLHLRFSIACQLSSWIEGDEEEPFHFQKKMSRKDENIFLLVSILSIT